jgi:YfiH family protein
MKLKKINEITLLSSQINNLHFGLTTRLDGTSSTPYDSMNMGFQSNDRFENIINNKTLLASTLGFKRTDFVCGFNTHTINVKYVTKKDKGAGLNAFTEGINETDGLFTDQEDLVLSCYHADCAPIYFYTKGDSYIGIAHAGWKGTINGIVEEMIKAFNNFGVDSKDIYIHIGPHISYERYEVGDDVIDLLKSKSVSLEDTFKPYNDKYLLNILKINLNYALKNNIPTSNITYDHECTYNNKDLFFSYRRDGDTGRMQSFIYKKKQLIKLL